MRHTHTNEEETTLLNLLRSFWGMAKLFAVLLGASAQLLLHRPRTRRERALWLHRLCRRAVRIFGVEVQVGGPFPERGVLIANHLSYLDIVVVASIHPCVFVSKVEIRSWPLLGWMTTMAGTVYVARGRGNSARQAGSEMRVAAEEGLPVVFFPEGTTSNGESLLKFHSGLLSEALAAGQPITAAYLQYSLAANNGGRRASDAVAYWGEQPMLPHVFGFLSLRGVRADVTIASEPIRFAEGVASRKLAAVEARRAVCQLRDTGSARAEEMQPIASS